MKKLKKKVQGKNDLENYIYQMKNTIEDPKFKDLIKEDDRKKVEEEIKTLHTWMEQNQNANGEEYDTKRKELEQIWTPIITAAYQSGGGGGMPNMGGGMPDMSGGMGGMPNMGNDNNAGPNIDEVD